MHNQNIMDSVQTIMIGDQMRPIAPRRSSIKVTRDSASNGTESGPKLISEYINHYTNIENSQQATKINISATSQIQDPQPKQIKLVIANNTNNSIATGNTTKTTTTDNTNSSNDAISDKDSYLSTLIDEYQASLNRKDCDNTNCYRFKLISYRISQTLFERINVLKDELKLKGSDNNGVKKETSHKQIDSPQQQTCGINRVSSQNESNAMDHDSNLLNLVKEKNKRIQDLEKLVEDQRRLRLQDASQVEEKAARIKEWVANKLKELENQNRQLRDQNKKQKETVESLSIKLATMSPVSSPRRKNLISDNVQFIDQQSPIETIDIEKSLKTRRPQLKKTFPSVSSSSEDDSMLGRTQSSSFQDKDLQRETKSNNVMRPIQSLSKGCVVMKVNSSDLCHDAERKESPIYDSVTVEQINRRINNTDSKTQDKSVRADATLAQIDECSLPPPPPPPHQSNNWELQLYSLADQTLSTLLKQGNEKWNDSYSQPDSIDSMSYSDRDMQASRKSSSSMKNDLISLVRPSYTTINGDHVIDDFNFDSDFLDGKSLDRHAQVESIVDRRSSNDQSSQSSLQFMKLRKDFAESSENIDKTLAPNLFDSPMRTRSGKDSILRTQSVRRNPTPEKLYDFIAADLVKRGCLVKPGALKNHSRWFVLKNFHLYSHKSESEELSKAAPNFKSKLEPSCQINLIHQTGDCSFPFKITYPDKTLQLIADNAQTRDEWVRILTVAINMCDIEPEALTKHNSAFEGMMSVTRQGHNKRYYGILVNHVIFFLRSPTDPTPLSYLSVRGSKIREITDSSDYDLEDQELLRRKFNSQDCILAIYPKYSLSLDPIYITLGSQQDTDKWFYYLSNASGLDQSYGTQFEKTLTRIMVNNSMMQLKNVTIDLLGSEKRASGCLWKEHSVMLYSDRPISQPLTSLPNETLRVEAIELFKSILLFTQVPLEPIAIDYHVCLLQNCLSRFLKYPELRNEFYAQLIKQCTYVLHRCSSPKLSSGSGGSNCSSDNQASTISSVSPSMSECQFITDVQLLDSITNDRSIKFEGNHSLSQLNSLKEKTYNGTSTGDTAYPPSQSELLQVMQILAIAVSLNLPRGRMRWWLKDYLRKFTNAETNIGKYALYTLKAIDRTIANGTRDNVPSRTEIMSILLRNPYDHSNPHSLPISFTDGSYLVVEADGSTTVEEFMTSMAKHINIRNSLISDFYLFADDPSGSKDLHILEPQRKILDIIGWWEQTFRQNNSGRYQNTKVIKLTCKKRLVLRAEEEETQQERLLIVHQINQEVLSRKIPLTETLNLELAAVMAQLTFGDFDKSKDPKIYKRVIEKVTTSFLPKRSSSHLDGYQSLDVNINIETQLVNRWRQLSGKSAQCCIRVYLNCIRRLKLVE